MTELNEVFTEPQIVKDKIILQRLVIENPRNAGPFIDGLVIAEKYIDTTPTGETRNIGNIHKDIMSIAMQSVTLSSGKQIAVYELAEAITKLSVVWLQEWRQQQQDALLAPVDTTTDPETTP